MPFQHIRRLYPTLTNTPELPTCNEQPSTLSLPSAAQRLPTEIIQQIHLYIGPLDFQNARSTCSSWRYAGLDRWILDIQIRRGGWLSILDHEQNHQVLTAASLSNVVARETALMSCEDAEDESEADSCLFRTVIDHCVDFPNSAFSIYTGRPSKARTQTRSPFWHRDRLDKPVEAQADAKRM